MSMFVWQFMPHKFLHMKRSHFLYFVLWALHGILTFAEGPRPNILFILVDDQRADELGCAGDPYIKTPNIDRLAERGVRFKNMFVTTSICAASRASIFTGLTERTHGYTFGRPAVSADQVATSYPVLLKGAGYRTGFFGKYGVSMQSNGSMFDVMKNLHRSPFFHKLPDGSTRHVDELVGDHAIQFLESQPEDQPFCLSMSFNIAHAEDGDKRPGIGHYPWPKAVDGIYEDGEIPLPRLRDPEIFNNMPEFLQKSMNRSRYFWRWDTPEKYDANIRARFRMLTGMDGTIGRVMKALETMGFADNTVVIYTADNGYYRAERGFAGKWSHFEESLRVPLVIFDPRQSKEHAGRVVDNMALNIDLTATMVDLAGVEIPERYQGTSLKPILEGKVPSEWRKDYFCEHLMRHGAIPMWEGVRGERYKYARYITQNPVYEFLHDLEKDPDELQNFATDPEYQKVLEEMRSRTADYLGKYTNPDRPVDSKSTSKPKSFRGSIQKIKASDEGFYQFDGKSYAFLCQTPALGMDDDFTWEMEIKVLNGNSPGAVLLGNRITPENSDLHFMKVTAQRGIQFYGGNQNKSLKLPMNLPVGKWTQLKVQKTADQVSVTLNGTKVSEGKLTFPLVAMPCYLGGDPNQASEAALCEIRNAGFSVKH